MKIDINELSNIKGIGKKTLGRVREYFKGKTKIDINELGNVKGIGNKTLSKVHEHLEGEAKQEWIKDRNEIKKNLEKVIATDIYKAYHNNGVTKKALSLTYGIDLGSVSNIILGYHWATCNLKDKEG